MEGFLDRLQGGPDPHDAHELTALRDRDRYEAEGRVPREPDGLERGLPRQRGLERGAAEQDVPASDMGGLDRNLAGWAEDLKELVQDRQFRKLRRKVFELQERPEPAGLQRSNRHRGGFLQRTVHLILQPATHLRIEHQGKGHENDRQRSSVP